MTLIELKDTIQVVKNDYVKRQDFTTATILRSMELILDRMDYPENVDIISKELVILGSKLKRI